MCTRNRRDSEPPDGEITDIKLIQRIFFNGLYRNRKDYTEILKRIKWPKTCKRAACYCEDCQLSFRDLVAIRKTKCDTGLRVHYCNKCLSWLTISSVTMRAAG
jgi:hypothetical protein